MSSVRAEWDSAEEFQQFLKEARAKGARTKPLMRRVAGHLRSSTVRRIRQDELGQENAAVTRAVKEGDTPLMDRGQFVQGIATRATDEVAAVGSNARQASTLQTGETIEPQSAEKLAFPAGEQTRALQRRYGFDFEDLITGMREDGWDVWVLENAIMADKPATNDDAFPLLIRADEVTIPAYRPFRLTERDRDDIKGIVRTWLRDIDADARRP